jgi:hypothetical protein
MEWDSKSIFETVVLLGLATSMYIYSQRVWSPSANAFGSGSVDTAHIDKMDADWVALPERAAARKVKH